MKRKCALLALALVLIILGGILSNAIDTSFGSVKTERIYLVDNDGYTVTANLFIPKSASSDSPAPAMIITPGGDCPSDIGSPWATELARRGYVVALMDYTGCGDTEANPAAQYWTNNGAMELDTVYDYISALAFVDSDQIGCGGHSMGSLYSYRLALKRPVSLVISDVVYTDELPDYNFNFVQISGTHDEGLLSDYEDFSEIYSEPLLVALFGADPIEPNKLYGSFEDRTARILYPLDQTHQDDMISGQFISCMVSSVMNSMDAPDPIPSDSMIYGWKVFAHALAIIGLVMLMFTAAGILIDSSLFSSLKLASPSAVPGFARGTKGWWIAAIILTLIPVACFFPGTAAGNKMASNSLFQLGTTPNGFMVWTLFSAACLLVFFLVYHFCFGKKLGYNAASYGFATSDNGKLSIGYILKSALLALIIFLLAYCVILMLYRYANTDLHIWTSSLRPLNEVRSSTMPWYTLALLPYFTLFMLAGNSLRFSSGKRSGAKAIICSVLVGLAGMILLFAFYEITLRTNRPFYTENFAVFYMDLLSNVLPQFGIAAALSIYIRQKTNSFFTGILLGSAMVAFGMVSTNCIAMIIS